MTLDSSNVRVARTGAVYIAPYGTTLPTTAAASLDTAFVDLGYISEDGVTFTPTTTTNAVRAWQNAARVATTVTELDYTFQFVMIEDKGAVAKLYYRAASIAVAGSGQWTLTPDSATTTIFSFVIDRVDGSSLKRDVIAKGEVTDRGEQVYSNGDAVGYNATITAYYDATLGAPFKPYSNSTAWGYS